MGPKLFVDNIGYLRGKVFTFLCCYLAPGVIYFSGFLLLFVLNLCYRNCWLELDIYESLEIFFLLYGELSHFGGFYLLISFLFLCFITKGSIKKEKKNLDW